MRLIDESDVIRAVDKHTTDDDKLDEDISVILEEVKTAFDEEKVIEKMRRMEDGFGCSICPVDKAMGQKCFEDGQWRCDKELINKLFEIVEKGGIE